MTPDEARARFEDARVAHLATINTDGSPHLVPVTFALEGDRIYTAVDAKPKRPTTLRRIANVMAKPSVSVLVDAYDEDWSRLWWARADGVAEIIGSEAQIEHAFALLRQRYPQYRSTELVGPAMVVMVQRWSGWSAR